MQEKQIVAITAGTHTWSPGNDQVDSIVQVLRKRNIKTLDTARRYVRTSLHELFDALTDTHHIGRWRL